MISVEFLLVVALVILPILLGLMLLGRKLVTVFFDRLYALEQPLSRPVVWDSTGAGANKPVGAVIGYDAYSAPLILWRDNTAPFTALRYKPGVLLGVRPRRFTTDSAVYYTDANCSAGPMVRSAVANTMWPSAGFSSQMQALNYAVGNGNVLYHQPHPAAAGALTAAASVWISQDARDNSPAAGGSACVSAFEIASAITDDFVIGNPIIWTVTTTIPHYLETNDNVEILGCTAVGCGATWPVTVVGPKTFKFNVGNSAITGPGVAITPANGQAFRAALISSMNLVATGGGVDLDAGVNFRTPFRMLFPAALPITGPIGGAGG